MTVGTQIAFQTRKASARVASVLVCMLLLAPLRAQDDSHQRMLAALEKIKKETPEKNRYLGDKSVRDLRSKLAAVESGKGKLAPERHWQLLRALGIAELRLGNEDAALKHLGQAFGLLQQVAPKIGPKMVNDTIKQCAIASLRSAETQNCCAMHNADSCIVPLQGGGLHENKQGSQQAIVFLMGLLQQPKMEEKTKFAAIWLLNICHMTLGSYPSGVPEKYRIPKEAFYPKVSFPRFVNVAPELGLDTFNCSGAVITDDFNNDGTIDIFTTSWHTAANPHLFLKQKDGTFTDVAVQAGLKGIYGGLNAVQADYDNDGDIDIFGSQGSLARRCGPVSEFIVAQ